MAPRLWGFVAADLDPDTEGEVAHHLDTCDGCREHLTRIERICRLLRAHPPGTEMSARVHARLGSLLQGLEISGAADAPVSARNCTRRWEPRRQHELRS